MPDRDQFVDYYDILQVTPRSDLKVIESAYRYLAKIYHPDHETTADVARFTLVVEAYNTLKFPEKRAEYDAIHQARMATHASVPPEVIGNQVAFADALLQRNMLAYLYKAKRENFRQMGVPAFILQEHFGCSDDAFDFHYWYLKAKGLVATTEEGTLTITVAGVDHVISLQQTRAADRLLTDQSRPGEA